MTATTLEQLQAIQELIISTGRDLNDRDYRSQYHTDLSPLGWHVGHCAFTETFWLSETVLNDASATGHLHQLYFPENIPKPERGPALPEHEQHIAWCEQLQADNRELLYNPPAALRDHPLYQDEYLHRFLIQHHCQHYETMAMVLIQRQLQASHHDFTISKPLRCSALEHECISIPAGVFNVGCDQVDAFDNEVPPMQIELADYALARHPVSNADWLSFMEDAGYKEPRWWSTDGWQWRQENQIEHPEQWLSNADGQWFGVDIHGAHELSATSAVQGVSYFEAEAYISWVRTAVAEAYSLARLPHEYEWEIAKQQQLLNDDSQVWEWCANTFHPYEDFRPFPYENYSKPWFDGKHYSLRGSSAYTQAAVKRPSFRNFYNPDKRHIFSGLRLALDQ